MPRNIPVSFRSVAESNYSEEVDLCFVTISHQELAEPIRVVWDTKDYILNGNRYIGFPFDITLLSDDDNPPKAQLTIQNVDRVIGEAIRSMRSPPRLRIDLLSSSDFFTRSDSRKFVDTLIAFAGFENNDQSELSFGGGAASVVTDHVKGGDYAIKLTVNLTPGNASYRYLDAAVDLADAVFRFDFFMESLPSFDSYFAGIVSSGPTIMDLVIRPSGVVGSQVYPGDVASPVYSSHVITPGVWHSIKVRLKIHATQGVVQVYVDDTKVQSRTGLNTADSGNIYTGIIESGEVPAFTTTSNVAFWFDNLELFDRLVETPQVPHVPAKRIFYAGFETGDLSEIETDNTVVIATDKVKKGSYSAKIPAQATSAYAGSTSGPGPLDSKDAVIRFYGYFSGWQSSPDDLYFAGHANAANSGDISDFFMTNDGLLGAHWADGGSTTSDYVITPGQWHLFEFRTVVHASNGAVYAWVDGNLAIAETGINTASNGNISSAFSSVFDFNYTHGFDIDFWVDEIEAFDLQQRVFYTGFEAGEESTTGGGGTSLLGPDNHSGGTGLKISNSVGELKGSLSGGNNSITNPLAATGSVEDVRVGDLIVAVLGQQTALTVTAATDNLGNSYSAQNAGTDAGNTTGRMFYSRVSNAGTLTTVNFATTASANDASCCAAVFEGPFEPSPPIDKNPANLTNDTSNPMQANSLGTLSRPHELTIGWFAGANGSAGLDTSGDDLSQAASQRQSVNIETMISYLHVADPATAQTPGFATPGTIGNNVIGAASFQPGDSDAWVNSTTGHDLTDAIVRFWIWTSPKEATGDDIWIGGFANSSDDGTGQVVLDTQGRIGVKLTGGIISYSNVDFFLTPETWHLIELRMKVDASEGILQLWVDGQLAVSLTGLDTTTGGNIDRAFIGTQLATGATFQTRYFYDEFELLSLENINPDIVYTADKLYLQNAKVDALQISADIVGWDFLQRVWPSNRADQAVFPGLFR